MSVDEMDNQESKVVLLGKQVVKKDDAPVRHSVSSCSVKEFTFIPAEDQNQVRILCQEYEFRKESCAPGHKKWRCTVDDCPANLMFIESESVFTDVHLEHNHARPDLSLLNLQNSLKMKLSTPVVAVSSSAVEKCEYYKEDNDSTADAAPLPLDPNWLWDGPEPLREAVEEGHPPLPPTDLHCPVCFVKRSKFDVWKCVACTSTMKSWRDKLRYAVPRSLPKCLHSLYQPYFNCNGCRRRRLQWEWTRRQTRPLGLPFIQY